MQNGNPTDGLLFTSSNRHGLTECTCPPHSAQRSRAESCAMVNPIEIRESQLTGLSLIMRHSAPPFEMLPSKVACQAPLISPPLSAMPHGCKSWFHKQEGTARLLGDDVATCRSCFSATVVLRAGDEGGKLTAAIWFRHKKSARRSKRPSQP